MKWTTALFAAKWHPESVKYANLPDRYIKRAMEQIYYKTPRGRPNYRKVTVQREVFRFNKYRPWTQQFFMDNAPAIKFKHVTIEPIKHWSFFRGDKVEIMVGPDKGKQGMINMIVAERNWVFVRGLNTELRVMGKDKEFPGITMKEELPLLVTSDVQLVDPSDLKATPIEWRYTEEGDHVRVSTRTGRIIPVPVGDNETIDYKLPHLYNERPKDTLKADVEKITFEPELKTFEMDIMDKMGIKEDRVPKKYWWY